MLTQCRSLFTSLRGNKIASNMKYELMSHRRGGSMDMGAFYVLAATKLVKNSFNVKQTVVELCWRKLSAFA